MASEARRTAKALVERRSETFESRHPLEESRSRLATALERVSAARSAQFHTHWRTDEGRTILVAEFAPSPRVQRFLQLTSLVMMLMVASSAWVLLSPGEDRILRFLVPMFTVLAILGLPFVAVALGSQREADESRIRKAIRVALLDEEQKLPPAQKWKDEE
jgi:hypothetical protein